MRKIRCAWHLLPVSLVCVSWNRCSPHQATSVAGATLACKGGRGTCASSHSVAKLAQTLPCLHSVASDDDYRWRCCDWRPSICCGTAQRTHVPRAAFCCFFWRTSGCGQVTTVAGAATAGGGGGADGRSKSAGLYTTCNTHTTASDTWVTNEADVRHARRCKKACLLQ